MAEGSKKDGQRMWRVEKDQEEKSSPSVLVKEPAKEGEWLRKEVEFQEFVVRKSITIDWEVKKMRKENEGL